MTNLIKKKLAQRERLFIRTETFALRRPGSETIGC